MSSAVHATTTPDLEFFALLSVVRPTDDSAIVVWATAYSRCSFGSKPWTVYAGCLLRVGKGWRIHTITNCKQEATFSEFRPIAPMVTLPLTFSAAQDHILATLFPATP